MVNVAAAKRKLGTRRRRACSIAARKRRDSHRGYPDLHQTHRLEIPGPTFPVVAHFPDRFQVITFKVRVDRTDPAATGVIIDLGNEGSIGFVGGDLFIQTGGEGFIGTFIGAPVDDAELVVAFHPNLGQVRAWVDSELVIAGSVTTFPYEWAETGDLAFGSIAGVDVRSDLDVFEGELPRHFFEVGTGTGGTPLFDDLLFRATRQGTDLATSRFPYMEKPD